MPSPFDQSTYQVRFEWSADGLARLAPADVVVVVDVLRFSSTVADLVKTGQAVDLAEARRWSVNGAEVALRAQSPVVLLGSIRNAAATARAVRTIQERRAARTSVAIIAAGERTADGGLRFAVEDQLGAGAVIASLVDLGIDHTSPEAATAAESLRSLRRAIRHLLTASGSGRELAEDVAPTEKMTAAGIRPVTVVEAAELDAVDAVPVLRDGRFIAFG